MRYTTIIDISQCPELYRNHNIRLVYLHLVLKSGYHDYDRDQVKTSIRRLAMETDLTISAVRNALRQLEKFSLLRHENSCTFVRKFVLEQSITPRAKTAKRQKEFEAQERQKQYEQEQRSRRDEEDRKYKEFRKNGGDPFASLLQELEHKANAGDLEAAERLNYWKSIRNRNQKQEK